MRALAVLFSLVAVVFMTFAIAGMVTGRQSALTGGVIRALAVLSFAVAVLLGVLSR